MRKINVLMYVVAILISLLGCQNYYTKGVYELEITATEISNDHVGNEWRNIYKCNGRIIESGEQRIVPLETLETVKIDVKVTESDKWSDVGYGSLSVVLSDGYETSAIVTVTEKNGYI